MIEFLSYLGKGQNKFESIVGLSRGFVNNVGDSIREASLAKITSVYPELNINWLKTGEGEMLRPDVAVDRSVVSNRGRGAAAGHHGTATQTIAKGGVAGYVAGDLNNHGRDKTLEEVLRDKDAYIRELVAKLENTVSKSFERNERNMERLDQLIDQQASLIEAANLNTAETCKQVDRLISLIEKKI